MKEFWNMIQLVFTMIGGWLGYFLGGCDGLLLALLVFVVMDYVTGVMCAVADRTLSSEVGFKGICRKVLIFMLVGIGNVLDVHIIGTGSVIRTAVIFFYLSNEGISLLENAAHLGLPVPEKLKLVLEQLHQRAESGDVSAVAVKDADDAAGTEDAGVDADDMADAADAGVDADDISASGDEEGSDV
jgi:toxin secretion/phage lysis holin